MKRIRAKLKGESIDPPSEERGRGQPRKQDGRRNNGGAQPGGGRIKGKKIGTVNLVGKTAKQIREWAIQSGELPHVFLLRIMRGETIDGHTPTFTERVEAAKACSPYLIPRLQSIAITGEDGGPVKHLNIDANAVKNLSEEELSILERVVGKLEGQEADEKTHDGNADAYAESIGAAPSSKTVH